MLILFYSVPRRATPEDAGTIWSIVTEAYQVTIGNEGQAFKKVNRYTSLEDLIEDLQHYWIVEDESLKAVACIKVVTIGDTAHVGPLAVREQHQV